MCIPCVLWENRGLSTVIESVVKQWQHVSVCYCLILSLSNANPPVNRFCSRSTGESKVIFSVNNGSNGLCNEKWVFKHSLLSLALQSFFASLS